MKTKKFYEKLFKSGAHLKWDDAPGKLVLLNYLKSLNSAHRLIIDIGCGGGYFTNVLRQFFGEAEVIGIDISENAINEATGKYIGCKFYVGDAESSLVATNADIIVSYGVFEHLNHPERGMQCLCDSLKPGGNFALMMPTIPYYRQDRTDEGYYEDLNDPPQLQWNWRRERWESIFGQHGLKLLPTEDVSQFGAIKPGNFYFGIKE